ncbi:hypothetical protein [Bartonella grahamii]|uniref:hypothetical protein n=1 Tax=Bartonella grahamii TaxID=33045 RepID=UPI003AF3904F
MKKKYSTPNLIKAVSLSAAMATLLSSVSPVFAANFAFVGGNNNSTSGAGVYYTHGSHGSVVLSGDDDFCGADNVIGRGGKQQQGISGNQQITAEQQYERFIDEKVFSSRSPYGTTTEQVTWQSAGILTKNATYMGTNTGGSENIMPEAYGVYSFATGCGSAATGNYSTVFGAGATAKAGGAQAFGVSALASGKASVAMGVGSEASEISTVAIGGLATASGKNSISIGVRSKATLDDAIAVGSDATASGINSVAIGKVASASGYNSIALGLKTQATKEYAVAIGTKAEAQALGSIAIGGGEPADNGQERKVIAKGKNSIAIGSHTYADTAHSVAIGINAQVHVIDGVAVGGGSVSRVDGKVFGYDPVTNNETEKSDLAWKSTGGDFSVGNTNQNLTRQITNVAAGSKDTDAVNVAQLKALRNVIAGGGAWQLSANDKDPTDVNSGNIVDFSVKDTEVGRDNLKIAKNTTDNKHKIEFTLSDTLTLTKVTTGQSSMNDNGFFINDNGPRMTVDGIDAGDKKITNVAEGTEDSDAVNYKQLKAIEKATKTSWQLAVNGEDATAIGPNGTVNLQAAGNENKKNIKIEKDENHNVTFDLADDIEVMTVTAGESIMSAAGFMFTDGTGPSITVNGIHAGDKTIKGVAAGEQDTDAVNYKQLKDFTAGMKTGWKLSVDGNNATDVKAGNTVDLVASENEGGNKNIKIEKDKKNKVTFALNNNLKLTSVTTGNSIMSDEGFKFIDGNGPSITLNGIDAGDKKITKVAAGEQETDAVNYKQLKDVKTLAENGWKLSVDGNNATDVKAGSTVDFVASENEGGNKNIKIEKDKKNKVTFALNNNLKLTSVTTGNSIMSADGFSFVDGGPKITANGIDADDKKITGVQKGTHENDAVNVSQLNKVKDQITKNTLVKWHEEQKLITIGKEKGGIEIDITNDENRNRIISGVAVGKVSSDSTEAINGHQLFSYITNIVDFFGGEETDVLNGIKPTFTVQKTKHNNVTDAFAAVDSSITDIYNQINNVTENSLVKWDEGEKLITIGKEKGGTEISIVNKSGMDRTLSGVKDGTLSRTSTEAVNGSQLFKTNENVTTVTNDLKKVAQNTSQYFGGSTDVLEGIKPSFLIQDKEYHNVVDAFTGVNVSITNIDKKISDVVKNSLVKQEGGVSSPITIGKDTAGTEINIAGSGGSGRKISGVRAAEKGDEAVNKDQLDKSIQNITKDIETATAAAVLYDKENGAVNYGSVTLGGDKNNGPVALHNVNDGTIAQGSNDAINGSQISKISADIAKFFGGGAKFINGAFEGLKYTLSAIVDGKVGKANFYDVGSALTGLDKNVQDVNQRLTNVSNEFNQQIEGISKDALLWDDEEEAFVARHEKDGKKTKSKLKYLLDGEIAKGSTDAITGNQLYSMSNQLANYFGGGAKYENGKWTDPTFKIVQVNADGTTVEKEHHNVADAFGDINNGMSNINNRIDDVINKVDSDALKWNDKEKAYDAGRDGKPNKIINVADGKIEKGSKEAVNGGQLWETNERVTGVEKDVKHLTNRVDNISNTIADIGDTVLNIDAKVDNIDNKVNDIAEDAVRYDRDENGKKTNKITLAGGDPGEPVMIDNVADGKIEKGSKEAVNGGQLHDYTQEQMNIILDQSKHYTDQRVNNIVIDAIDDAVDQAKHYTDMKFDVLNYSIESVKKRQDKQLRLV